MLNKRRRQLVQALQSEPGQIILKNLLQDETKTTCLGSTSEITHYLLGRHDVVTELVRKSNLSDEDLHKIELAEINYGDNL